MNAFALSFPTLRRVAVDVSLTSADGLLWLDDTDFSPPIEGFAFPLLREVGASMTMDDNPHLLRAVFPQLQTVGGSLSVSGNANLSILTLDALQSVGGSFIIEANSSLADFSFPCLANVAGVSEGDDFVITASDAGLQCIEDMNPLLCQVATESMVSDLRDDLGAACPAADCTGITPPTCQ
jgi:hypothetical protein